MVRYTNERMKKDVKKFINKVRKHYDLNKIIIFGSRARGDYFLDSDIDMILVSDDFKNLKFTNRISNILEYWEGKVDLEVICYTLEEFEKLKKRIGLVRKAVEEGIEIK